jgi:hypothetical protein
MTYSKQSLVRQAGQALALAALIPVVIPALAQAQIPTATGSTLTGDEAVSRTYYVATNGNDANNGSSSSPFRTVRKGVDTAVRDKNNGTSAKVIIRDGTYRESVGYYGVSASNNAVLIVQAANPDKAIISGSDTAGWNSNWTVYSSTSTSKVWRHAWNFGWALGPNNGAGSDGNDGNDGFAPTIARRREVIFVNDVCLKQVTSLSALSDYSFHTPVSVAYDANGKPLTREGDQPTTGDIYVKLPASINLNGSTTKIEVVTRAGLLDIANKNNLVFRGLAFQHDGSHIFNGEDRPQAALRLIRCNNVLLDRCRFRWSNSEGFKIKYGSNITIRGSSFNHNGHAGKIGVGLTNVLVEDSDTSYNNWRGAWGGYYRWSPAGFKFLYTRLGTWRRHRAVENLCTGMWMDLANEDIRFERCFVHHNLARGIHLEAGPGPMVVLNSIVCHNRTEPTDPWKYGSGIVVSHAAYNTLHHNICYDNDVAQISVRDDFTHRTLDSIDGQMIDTYTRNLTLFNNACVATNDKQYVLSMPNREFDIQNGVEMFYSTLDTNYNCYWHPLDEPLTVLAFRTGVSTGTVTPRTFGNWKWYAEQDYESKMADPLFVDPANHDFRLRSGSPVAGWGLPTGP